MHRLLNCLVRRSLSLLIAAAVVGGCGLPRAATAVELTWNDATGIWALADDRDAPVFLYDTFETRGLAIGPDAARLVWSDVLPLAGPLPGGVIREGSTSGGDFDTLARHLVNPAGVAIDPLHGNLYWTDLGDNLTPSTVYMARRDGSDVRPIIRGEWLSQIEGIAVDPAGGRLYFSYVNPLLDSLYNGGIGRANLDGSNVEGIIGGLGKPNGVAIDTEGKTVFWADARKLSPGGGDGEIAAADLDGDNQRLLLSGLELPYGVALDLERRDIYWTDSSSGKIQRTSMSGILPYFEDVVTGLDNPTAIAIAAKSSLPLAGDANNDGRVDRADAAIVAANFGRSGAEVNWSMGDFDGDLKVSLFDLAALQQHLQLGPDGPTSLVAASVPEPAAWALASSGVVACAGITVYRSRKRRSLVRRWAPRGRDGIAQ